MIEINLPGARAVFTSSEGGASPYGALNLGDQVGQDPQTVAQNREAVAQLVKRPVVWMCQTHSTVVKYVEAPQADPVDADGIIVPAGLAAAVQVADCLPVVFSAPKEKLVAAVHAGRKGIEGRIATEAIRQLRELGATQIFAALGPSICAQHYEVEVEVGEKLAQHAPQAVLPGRSGHVYLDLPQALALELESQDVPLDRSSWSCTYSDSNLYSYRRNPQTGRQAAIVFAL
ncbi:hypothetical protein BSR29_03790 [Boudabousia liubingyangii]|uniref:Purine nucleoside phosphorylase n=1 Tax=Boudabousia liubingyangii TaxID=1921764 RepID=A0A1Q5PN57_9ACTO|nr:polyphenol oxidase family protein [Boudabousia liubingyangii]OKL48972.1 hypothetical protein BSR29_03790 [Boudabousia liubingyangii]